jgi:hypothetical protein
MKLLFLTYFLFQVHALISFAPPSIVRLAGGVPGAVPLTISGNGTWSLTLNSSIPFGFYVHPHTVYEASSFTGCDYFLTLGCLSVNIQALPALLHDFLIAMAVDMGEADGVMSYRLTSVSQTGQSGAIQIVVTHQTVVDSPSTSFETALIGGLAAVVGVLSLLSIAFIILIRYRARQFFAERRGAREVSPLLPPPSKI